MGNQADLLGWRIAKTDLGQGLEGLCADRVNIGFELGSSGIPVVSPFGAS